MSPEQDIDKFFVTDESWNAMVRYADKHLNMVGFDPEDVVQEAYLRAFNAFKKKSESAPPKPGYIWKTLKTTIIDIIRKKERKHNLDRQVEPSLIEHPEIESLLGLLSKEEIEIFFEGKAKPAMITWADLAKDHAVSNASLRKKYSRASLKLRTELMIKLYLEERYEEINKYRLPVSFMNNMAYEFLKRELPLAHLQNAFRNEKRNRTIQNATWALAAIGLKNPKATMFLEKELVGSRLFRGNKTYIAEALIGLDSKYYSNLLRRKYFHQIFDMNSRVTGMTQPFREQPAILERCLVDVIRYNPVGNEIPACDIEFIKKKFLAGTSDVDLHRTLSWLLLRTMSNNGEGMLTVVHSLVDEEDQTNAYYVTKFIMGPGIKMFPELLLNDRTYKSLRKIKFRWPQNFYFSESAARLSMRLKNFDIYLK